MRPIIREVTIWIHCSSARVNVKGHARNVTLEVEGIDRMYLNAYVPGLPSGVAAFFRRHRGQPFASSALMDPISRAFVAAIHAFV